MVDSGADDDAVSERTDRRINSALVVDDASVDVIVLISVLYCVTSYWGGGTFHCCMAEHSLSARSRSAMRVI